MQERRACLYNDILGIETAKNIPKKLDYQSLIAKQQQTIKFLQEENKKLWQYILYIMDLDTLR